jgi:hypothetical protein
MKMQFRIIYSFWIALALTLKSSPVLAASKAPPALTDIENRLSSEFSGKGALSSSEEFRVWELQFEGISLPVLTVEKGNRFQLLILNHRAQKKFPEMEVTTQEVWAASDVSCLVMEFQLSQGIGFVRTLATRERGSPALLKSPGKSPPKCPGPEDHQGAFFMRFVDRIAKVFSLPSCG